MKFCPPRVNIKEGQKSDAELKNTLFKIVCAKLFTKKYGIF